MDTTSLKIFIQKENPDNVDQAKKKSANHNSESSSNSDEKEHLDQISAMAMDEENQKKTGARSDFTTPKKESKNSQEKEGGRVFQLYHKDKNEEMTHSANRLKTKGDNPHKSYSSFTRLPYLGRKHSDNYSYNNHSFNNYTLNDDNSEKN